MGLVHHRRVMPPPCSGGVGLTNIVWGSPVKVDPEVAGNYIFDGTLFSLLGPVPLLGGLTFVALFLTHGRSSWR